MILALYLVLANISTLYASEIQSTRPPTPDITAGAAIIIDVQNGFILYEKNSHELHYPASLAKIMTALLAIELYGGRLDEPIYFSRNAVFSIPRNSSHIAMDEGETLTMMDALYGLMLASANEVAHAIAEHISGDIATFVDLMNRRAQGLGAENTHFENPTGLHSPYQQTTAYDMALILSAALRHPLFVDLISTRRHDISPTERQPLVRELLNDNRMIQPAHQHYNERVVGGKTGFTNEAQHTLATYAVYGGRELIVVTLRCSRPFTDTHTLLDYGFSIPYVRTTVFDKNTLDISIPVYHTEGRNRVSAGEVRLSALHDLFVSMPTGFDMSQVGSRLIAPGELRAPIQQGDLAGRLIFYMMDTRGTRLGEIELRAAHAVPIPEIVSTIENAEHAPATFEANPAYGEFNLSYLVSNYYLTFILPLTGFVGVATVFIILRIRYIRKYSRSGRYSVIGSQAYRYNTDRRIY